MIEVTNLTKKYGDQAAVDNLSFKVEKGQIYGFLGPNGAGKSTTMNIITGYLAASSGTVTINGKDIQKEPEEAKKHIGYLPELPPLYTEMTVLEYLRFVAELKKVPKKEREKQIREVMDMTQIAEMQGRLIKNLSKGYRQRVGLAQAILGYPEVIILDEPTVGLDPKQIIEIRDLIRRLGENHTVILSSHILSEVSAVCDHIMIISHGKLVASDSPEGLENRLTGSEELRLEVKGGFEQVCSALSGIPGIQSVDKKEESGGIVKLSVYLTDGSGQEASVQEANGQDGSGQAASVQDVSGQDGSSQAASVQDVNGQDGSGQDVSGQGESGSRDGEVREKVFFALAEAGLPILEMHLSRKTLEDIFLELTGEAETLHVSGREKKRLFRRNEDRKDTERNDADRKDGRTEAGHGGAAGAEADPAVQNGKEDK